MRHLSHCVTKTLRVDYTSGGCDSSDLRTIVSELVKLFESRERAISVTQGCSLVTDLLSQFHSASQLPDEDLVINFIYNDEDTDYLFSPAEIRVLVTLATALIVGKPFFYINLNNGAGLLVLDIE